MPNIFAHITNDDALKAARIAAEDYHKSPIVSLSSHDDQGCFSATFIVNYADKTEAIVQLRDGRIDTALVALARGLLGDIVPDVRAVKATATLHAYGMPLIHGTRWSPLIKTSLEEDVAIARQFGSILAKCGLGIGCDTIVDSHIIPRLENVLKDKIPSTASDSLRFRVEALLHRAANLKQLPLVLCHVDPNPFNVILDETDPTRIVGLIDWEGATLLPFGMNAYQIRFIAVINRQRVDYPDPKSAIPIAMAFWDSFTVQIAPKLKHAVVDAMCIGLILLCEFYEGQGVPNALSLQNAVARLDWLEEIYRPLCG